MTCHARLKVTRDEAVGHVLPCPRCHSMVHVVAPDRDDAPAADAEPCDDTAPPTSFDPLVPPGEHWRIAWLMVAGVLTCAMVTAIWTVWRRPPVVEVASSPSPPVTEDRGTRTDRTERSSAEQPNEPPAADLPQPAEVPVEPGTDNTSASAPNDGIDATPSARELAAVDAQGTPSMPDAAATSNRPDGKPASVNAVSADETTADQRGNGELRAGKASRAGPDPNATRSLPRVKKRPDPTPAIRKVDTPSEPGRALTLKTRLGLRLNSISVHETPLAEYVRFLSELSAVPITLDVDALASRNLSPIEPVSISAQDVMIADALRRVIGSLDLVATIEDSRHVVITTSDAPPSVERVYEVDDLQDHGGHPRGVASTTPMAECLPAVIAPRSWASAGGDGSITEAPGRLTITQSHAVHKQIETFLARLRRVRGLPAKPPDDPLKARTVDLAGDRTVSVTFVEPVRLARVMRQVEVAAGIQLVVDWRSLESLGLGPDTLVVCSVTDAPVDIALRRLLSPLGAAWRPLGDAVVHVSTNTARFAYQPDLVSVAEHIEAGWTPADLIAWLREATGENPPNSSQNWGTIHYDGPSRHLVLAGLPGGRAKIERLLEHPPRLTRPDD